MTTILITNDSIPSTDFANVVEATKRFLAKFAPAWKMSVEITLDANAKHDMIVHITEANRHPSATGYHGVSALVPTSWCSPRAAGRIYGHYAKALMSKGKMIHPESFTPGLVTTVCHEIAEMLVDPVIANYSAVDPQGRHWLIEVADHVFGVFALEVVAGNNCVLPDCTTPAFYDRAGKAPFSIYGGATAPFTMTSKGYGYYKGATGLVKI